MKVTNLNIQKIDDESIISKIEYNLFDYLENDYKLLKRMAKEYDCFIAGGSLTSILTDAKINDIDVYFDSEVNIEKVASIFEDEGYERTETVNAITLIEGHKIIQLIKIFTGIATDILPKFDFTSNMIAYQPNTKILWMALQAHGAIDGTYLMYNTNCEYPIGAMKRALKYTKRGFTLCQETFLSIVLSIGKLDLKDTNVLNQQLSFYGVIRLDDPTIRDLFSDHFILDLIEYKRPNGNQIKRQIAIKNKYKDIGKDLILSLETGRTPNIVYTRFKDQPTEEENIDLYNLDIPFPEFVENLIDKRYESIIE